MTCWHNQLDSVKVEKMSMTLWLSVLICFNLNSHSIKSNCHLLFQSILDIHTKFLFWIIELPYHCKLLNIYPVLEYIIKLIEVKWKGVSYPAFFYWTSLAILTSRIMQNEFVKRSVQPIFFYSYTHKIKVRLD